MTQPLRKYASSDVPEYSSYPAEPDREIPQRYISELDAMPQNNLDEHGRKIGAALGRLVNRLNEVTGPMQARMSREVRRLNDEVDLAKTAAGHTYEDLSRKAGQSARQALYEARARMTQARRRAEQTIDQYPVETLAAAGVAGILLGIGLRAWGQNRRDYRG